MGSRGEALPAAAPANPIDQGARWFWNFLKAELSPYPERVWVIGRMTIAATIVMVLVMTFRLPNGFLAAIYTLFLSRENPTATLRAGYRSAVAFILATAYTVVGVMMTVDDPLTHFLWIVVTLFIAFYLIRIISDYGTGVAFGFMIAGAIPLWDETTLTLNTRVENTLWLAFSVLLGSAVTIAVEYVFRRVHPATDLNEGIEGRLQAVEDVLREASVDPTENSAKSKIVFYASLGTSRLRRLLDRSEYSAQFISRMNAAVALLGRLVDLASSLRIFRKNQHGAVSAEDRERCGRLASEISKLRHGLRQHRLPQRIDPSIAQKPSDLPFLSTMETIVALMPQVLAGSQPIEAFSVPMEGKRRESILLPDAFSNPANIQFAMRGMLAATACYVVYTAIDWRGLSTSIATCIITALSTIGSSRQKQFLRLAGALIGGFIFGMGAQVFVLPYLNSIAGFTLLFAAVTAISAWIATASPRLSYLGIQLALAFYLINMQEFAIQTSLSVARDRVFGVLLGLVCMWLVFDRLWVRNALDQMQILFAQNLERLAELADLFLKEDDKEAVNRIRRLQDQINIGFQAVSAQWDAVLFEFGPSRDRNLKIRDDLRRWQPPLRTLLLMQITASEYRLQQPIQTLPRTIGEAQVAFERDIARMMRVLANEVSGKSSEAGPNLEASAADLQREIRDYYAERGLAISPASADLIGLAETVASILSPLYQDIHSTFAETRKSIDGLQQLRAAEA